MPRIAGIPIFILSLGLLGSTLVTSAAYSAGAPLYRPVLIAYSNVTGNPNHTDGNPSGGGLNNHPVQMNPLDGSGQQYIHNVNYYGDLTHGGGERFVLDVLPAQGGSTLVAQSEDGTDGNPSFSQVLHSDPAMRIFVARWSIDASRVLLVATRNLDTGTEAGIYVGEVVYNGLEPVGLEAGVRLVFPLSLPLDGNTRPEWSSDNRRITWAAGGAAWVGDVDSGAAPTPLTAAGNRERRPMFSPVPGDNRVAFARYMGKTGSGFNAGERWDLFTYDTETGGQVQVTNSTRCKQPNINVPSWSPDGRHLAFMAGNLGESTIWRIPADGSGKAVQLTRTSVVNKTLVNSMGGPVWRN